MNNIKKIKEFLNENASQILKKYDIDPMTNPDKSVDFETENGLEGKIITVGDNNYNVAYWDGKRHDIKNINIKDLEKLIISWHNDGLI